MTSDVTFNDVANLQQNTLAANQSLAGDFADFLNLLTTQLQNQDPLEPMKSEEFTNQLVQFAGVEQQINTNQKLDSLVQFQFSNALSQSLSFVGLNARYSSGELYYDGTTPVTIDYALEGDASRAKLFILDEDGKRIYEEDISNNEGLRQVVWDGSRTGGGLAEPGTYSVSVEALDANGKPVDSSTVVSGRVTGIEAQNGQIFAIVGERAVALSNIINVTEPKELESDEGDDETVSSPDDNGGDPTPEQT